VEARIAQPGTDDTLRLVEKPDVGLVALSTPVVFFAFRPAVQDGLVHPLIIRSAQGEGVLGPNYVCGPALQGRCRLRGGAMMRALFVRVSKFDHHRFAIRLTKESDAGWKIVGRESGGHGDRRDKNQERIQCGNAFIRYVRRIGSVFN
jgi:hypothetical protein